MTIHRRTLLGATAGAGVLSTLPLPVLGTGPAAADTGTESKNVLDNIDVNAWSPIPFPLGVASGDPWPDSVVLWTRLAGDPMADDLREDISRLPVKIVEEKVHVTWSIAADKGFANIVRTGIVTTSVRQAYSVHAVVRNLLPGRTYYYRFEVAKTNVGSEEKDGVFRSETGTTRTAPADAAVVERVRFGVLNCQDRRYGHKYAALRDIATNGDLKLDFVVHLGDYVYEDGKEHDNGSIEYYRKLHAGYKNDRMLRAAHAAHPWFLTWDNHEVGGSYAGAHGGKRRDNAYQAYYEHLPVRLAHSAVDPAGAGEQTYDVADPPQMYGKRSWGGLLDLLILDLRQYREKDSGKIKTILGDEQKAWLVEEMEYETGRWRCLLNPEMLSPLRKSERKAIYVDDWNGCPSERDEVLGRMRERHVKDLVVITGDWHASFVMEVQDELARAGTKPPLGVEFVSRAVSSELDAPYRKRVIASRGHNPHLKYFEGGSQGYDLHHVTPELWVNHMRVVKTPTNAKSEVYTRTTWVVKRGEPEATQVVLGGDEENPKGDIGGDNAVKLGMLIQKMQDPELRNALVKLRDSGGPAGS